MTSLRIALAQFDFQVGAVAGNVTRIAEMIAVARDEYGADLVLFPELALSGYPPEDLLIRPSFLRDCAEGIEALAKAATGGIVAVVPGRFSVCVWSPELNPAGNSLAGMAALELLSERIGGSVFSPLNR